MVFFFTNQEYYTTYNKKKKGIFLKMDNILEKLTSEREDNYKKYLRIMSSSFYKSSKKMIPFFATNRKRILDVGCGSGILVENIRQADKSCYILGIDLNENAINECNKKDIENAFFEKISLEDLALEIESGRREAFDCILFSSVLHEFSSYAKDKNIRYTKKPIEEAVNCAKKCLSKDGIIVIRDGLKESKTNFIELTFKNEDGLEFLEKFKEEFHRDIYIKKENNKLFLKATDLKEFLFTYTWGWGSFNREVKEQFGILSKKEWKQIIKSSNLEITAFQTFEEEYLKYLDEKIEINDGIEGIFKESVIFIVAKNRND